MSNQYHYNRLPLLYILILLILLSSSNFLPSVLAKSRNPITVLADFSLFLRKFISFFFFGFLTWVVLLVIHRIQKLRKRRVNVMLISKGGYFITSPLIFGLLDFLFIFIVFLELGLIFNFLD